MDKLRFVKLNDGATIPSKKDEDAGYDVYACFEEDYTVIEPNEVVAIPTGIASVIDEKYMIDFEERGSTGIKGMAKRCGVIDSSYRGEWFVALSNVTNKTIIIAKYPDDFDGDKHTVYPYDKAICQAVVREVPKLEVEVITEVELMEFESERGKGKLGNSGK